MLRAIRLGAAALAVCVCACATSTAHEVDADTDPDAPFVPLDAASTEAGGGCGADGLQSSSGTNGNVVRVVYLTPTDRPERTDVTASLAKAIRHVQTWWYGATNRTLTFSIASPAVLVVGLAHEANYYATHRNGDDRSLWFWFNVLGEARAATASIYGDRSSIWLYYVDADPACDQALGGSSSTAILPANAIRGLMNEPTVPSCSGDSPTHRRRCLYVGGMANRLGIALGLHMPPGCADDDRSTTCEQDAIMWQGSATYPNARLLEPDLAVVRSSQFFSDVAINECAADCNAL